MLFLVTAPEELAASSDCGNAGVNSILVPSNLDISFS